LVLLSVASGNVRGVSDGASSTSCRHAADRLQVATNSSTLFRISVVCDVGFLFSFNVNLEAIYCGILQAATTRTNTHACQPLVERHQQQQQQQPFLLSRF
jgi:hypothetical protein